MELGAAAVPVDDEALQAVLLAALLGDVRLHRVPHDVLDPLEGAENGRDGDEQRPLAVRRRGLAAIYLGDPSGMIRSPWPALVRWLAG